MKSARRVSSSTQGQQQHEARLGQAVGRRDRLEQQVQEAAARFRLGAQRVELLELVGDQQQAAGFGVLFQRLLNHAVQGKLSCQ